DEERRREDCGELAVPLTGRQRLPADDADAITGRNPDVSQRLLHRRPLAPVDPHQAEAGTTDGLHVYRDDRRVPDVLLPEEEDSPAPAEDEQRLFEPRI